jgi:hypothetical protein
MVWKVTRTNTESGAVDVAPADHATGEIAFRASMANCVAFIINHWDSFPGDGTEDGPQDNGRFKIYIERRPGRAEVELRYDYPDAGDRTTNQIYWRVAEI